MKKVIILLTVLSVMFSATAFASENDLPGVTVTIDGNNVEFDVPPQIIEGRTMVPMRKIFETFSAKVEWVEENQMILATYKETLIMLQIYKNIMIIQRFDNEENKRVDLDVPPQIIDGRTLVPVRAISEALGAKVEWNDETQTVIITKE